MSILWNGLRVSSRIGGVPSVKPTSVNDRIMILKSGTGSGKSTTLSPELYRRFQVGTGKNIAVTQPRVLTAMSIPVDVIEHYDEMVMGETIGYQTGDFTNNLKGCCVYDHRCINCNN